MLGKLVVVRPTQATSAAPSRRPRLLVLLMAIGLASGCWGPDEEVNHATYFVVNRASSTVTFLAVRLWNQGSLEVGVPAGQVGEVDRVTEPTGGHTFPSNFYESYTVKQNGVPATRRFTPGDWRPCRSLAPDEEGREELCLEIQDADFL